MPAVGPPVAGVPAVGVPVAGLPVVVGPSAVMASDTAAPGAGVPGAGPSAGAGAAVAGCAVRLPAGSRATELSAGDISQREAGVAYAATENEPASDCQIPPPPRRPARSSR